MRLFLIPYLCISVLLFCCSGPKGEPPARGEELSSEETPGEGAEPGSDVTAQKVVRLVFIDKENACACTRERCDEGWSALQGALASLAAKPEVERLYMDTQEELVAPYRSQRPILVAPALYFFRQDGSLADMLQGEIEDEQISSLLR